MKKNIDNIYKSGEALKAAMVETEIGGDYLRALFSMVMRGVEVEEKTAKAWLTSQRWLELTKEVDGVISTWVIGLIEIAGKLTATAVYLGDLNAASEVVRLVRRAKAIIAEAIERGSRAFPLIAEATTPSGERVFVYHLSTFSGHARPPIEERVGQWMSRNSLALLSDIAVTPSVPAEVTPKTTKRPIKAASLQESA